MSYLLNKKKQQNRLLLRCKIPCVAD